MLLRHPPSSPRQQPSLTPRAQEETSLSARVELTSASTWPFPFLPMTMTARRLTTTAVGKLRQRCWTHERRRTTGSSPRHTRHSLLGFSSRGSPRYVLKWCVLCPQEDWRAWPRFWNGSELSTRISNPSARRHTPRLLASSGGSRAAVSECTWCPCPGRSKGKETISSEGDDTNIVNDTSGGNEAGKNMERRKATCLPHVLA
mmetsp:Transcript_4528/g.7087  ORF Transcript_4528/g.7087 Transcript_4528/m.7087 type:complete len:202 (-) Transcript_4528:76-681(-)